MKKEKTIRVLTAFIAMMFFYASVVKLRYYQETVREMRNQVFPIVVADTLSWFIPLVEIGIVGCLLYEPSRRIGLWLSLVLLSLFSIYIPLTATKIFGRTPCSCAGILWQNSTYWHQFGFNLLFIIMVVIALIKDSRITRGVGSNEQSTNVTQKYRKTI